MEEEKTHKNNLLLQQQKTMKITLITKKVNVDFAQILVDVFCERPLTYWKSF